MNTDQRKRWFEALTEALVIVGVAKAEAESYTNDPRLQKINSLQEHKRWEVTRYRKTEKALNEMRLNLVEKELLDLKEREAEQ